VFVASRTNSNTDIVHAVVLSNIAITRWRAARHVDAKRAMRLAVEALGLLVRYFKSEIERYGLPV
jgi:hypothetical protein